MKAFLVLVIVVVFVQPCMAQEQKIIITTDKTSCLIFPYAIKHVDRGSKEVLVEAVPGADHILLVKAATKEFPGTNLSIVTGDGNVYSIGVSYGEPDTLVYHFPPQLKMPVPDDANSLLDNPATMKGPGDASGDMIAKVIGIYIKEEVIFFQLQLSNRSAIAYDIDFLRLYIRDKKKAKRTAAQEIQLTPLHIAGNAKNVKANTNNVLVIALQKFTIPEAKYFAIEFGEKNGGRDLLLKVGNKKIIHAISLPDVR